MADQDDFLTLFKLPFGLDVDFGHQRAGGVEEVQIALLSFGRNRFRHAMGGENDGPVIWAIVQLVDKDCAHALEPLHDPAIVDDLMPDINRCAIFFYSLFNYLNGAIHASAKAAGAR